MEKNSSWLKELDQLLRGGKTRAILDSRGTQAIRLRACIGAALLLGVVYGLCMGLFAVMARTPPCWEQLLLTAIKVPALFLLTLVVTLPSLYVFSALLGTRLGPMDVLRVLVAAITVNLCVLAAFGPITAFFTISTTSYAFMKILNVVFYSIAGVLGLGFLIRVLGSLEARLNGPPADSGAPPALNAAATPSSEPRMMRVLSVWLVLYALVAAQMGWVLRPFIGDPAKPFQVFRAREANIFIDIVRTLGDLFN
jgi:hypothetical protein